MLNVFSNQYEILLSYWWKLFQLFQCFLWSVYVSFAVDVLRCLCCGIFILKVNFAYNPASEANENLYYIINATYYCVFDLMGVSLADV